MAGSLRSHAAFANAMKASGSQAGGKILNEKGCVVEESTNVPGVDAFHKLVRDETLETKTGKILYNKKSKNRGHMGTKKPCGIPDMETEAGRNSVVRYVGAMLEDAKTRAVANKDTTELVRTFIMPFLKRRTTRSTNSTTEGGEAKAQSGGEGEKLLFYQIYLELYKEYPYTMRHLLRLIPKFGCWRDVFAIWKLWEWRVENRVANTAKVCDIFKCAVLHLVWKQLTEDKEAMVKDGENANISLCAKWVPSEFKQVRDAHGARQVPRKECMISYKTSRREHISYNFYTALALLFANGYTGSSVLDSCGEDDKCYGEMVKALKTDTNMGKARRLLRVTYLSPMRTHLNVVEKLMCDGKWSKVKPEMVPSRAQHKYQRAFLDESRDGERRHEGDAERDACRKNFLDVLTDPSKIKTAGVDPHEILRDFIEAGKRKATSIKELKRMTWKQKVKEVYQSIVDRRKELEEAGVDVPQHLGNLIGMADVSGSMIGLPMEVAIALTLFLAALQEEAGYRPLAISFTDVPRAFDFTGMTLEQRIDKITSNVGYHTDFGAAMKLVLDTIKSTGHHMDMVVFTDEQFDTQYRPVKSSTSRYASTAYINAWTTFHQQYLKDVAKAGLTHVPRVIYWNLRAHTQGVHTDAHHPGVQMLQGYNLNNLRFVLFAEGAGKETEVDVEVKDEVTGDTTIYKVKTTKVTPYDTYCAAMNDTAFDSIREVLYNSEEKLLKLVHNPLTVDTAVSMDMDMALVEAVDSTSTTTTDNIPVYGVDEEELDMVSLVAEMRRMKGELEELRKTVSTNVVKRA